MPLVLESLDAQQAVWPQEGRHILAQYDDEQIVVYQAYRPEIADYALKHQAFGGPWSFSRMSWIKPNFLWMMFRCGWAEKEGQERVLAVSLRRAAFDEILGQALASAAPDGETVASWREKLAVSDVRVQWDPDHDVHGHPVERRALQLGLRGEVLRRYASEWVVGIEDITEVVRSTKALLDRDGPSAISTPREREYVPDSAVVAGRVGISARGSSPIAAS